MAIVFDVTSEETAIDSKTHPVDSFSSYCDAKYSPFEVLQKVLFHLSQMAQIPFECC
jgi:hypothetical protein